MINTIFLIKYIFNKKNEIKKLHFTGVCINNKKEKLIIKNRIKKEYITFKLNIKNPLIFYIKPLKKYFYTKKIKKIFFKKKKIINI